MSHLGFEPDDYVGGEERASDIIAPGLISRLTSLLDRPFDLAASVAPQGAHWGLCLSPAVQAMLDQDGHPHRIGFMPPVKLPRRMWAASDVQFLQPLQIGARVERASRIISVFSKKGTTGNLVFVEIEHFYSIAGNDHIRERQTIVYRDAGLSRPASQSQDALLDTSRFGHVQHLVPDETLLFRYSALTFNAHRIHYDRQYTVEIEGYRDLVVQGPLMATLLLDLCRQTFGDNALSAFCFRAQSPAFVGRRLNIGVQREEGSELELAVWDDGSRLIMSGSARLKP